MHDSVVKCVCVCLGQPTQGKDHPIVPVMLGDARLATEFADEMLEKSIYVIGFSYPVVPKGLSPPPSLPPLSPSLSHSLARALSSPHPSLHSSLNPSGEARIRVQLSATHSREDMDKCLDAFIEIGRRRGVIP